MKILNVDYTKRIYGLDILRAMAILFVVYAHSLVFLEQFLPRKILRIFQIDGVTIFFVLSGFLIGRILIKIFFIDEKFSFKKLKHFWMRRWIRTLPNYFFVLTILFVLYYFLGLNTGLTGQSKAFYYFFVQNLWYPHPDFFPEAWSLSVEEWFYLLFPLSLFIFSFIFSKHKKLVFLSMVILFILVGFCYRYVVCAEAIENSIKLQTIYASEIRKVVIARIDSIMYGVIGAYVFIFKSDFWKRNKTLFFFLGLLLFYIAKAFPWPNYPMFRGVFQTSWLAIATLFLLPILNDVKYSSKPGFIQRSFTLISLTSYSMYLINLRIFEMLDRSIFKGDLIPQIKLLIFWLLVFVFSILLYKLFEEPVLKLRDRYYKKTTI